MKFRCERDALVEALGAAGRAVATRGGALPVLVRRPRLELHGDQLEADRQRPRSHHLGREPRSAATATASRCCRPSSLSDIVRAAARPARSRVEIDDDEARISAGRFAVRGARSSRPTSSRSCPSPPTSSVDASTPRPSPTPCARSSRPPSTDDVPPDPHRCAAWPPRATACAWSPPTRTGSPCATSRARRCWPRASRCWCRRRALERARTGCCRRAERGHPAPRRARRRLRGRRRPAHHPPDRGRVPELPRPDPERPPEPADASAASALLEARAPRAAAGPGGHPGAPGA